MRTCLVAGANLILISKEILLAIWPTFPPFVLNFGFWILISMRVRRVGISHYFPLRRPAALLPCALPLIVARPCAPAPRFVVYEQGEGENEKGSDIPPLSSPSAPTDCCQHFRFFEIIRLTPHSSHPPTKIPTPLSSGAVVSRHSRLLFLTLLHSCLYHHTPCLISIYLPLSPFVIFVASRPDSFALNPLLLYC